MGAYFYFVTDLTYRWYKKDITTHLLWKGCARFLIIYAIGLVFTKIWPDVPIYYAFLIGIMPETMHTFLGGREKDLVALAKDDAGGIFKQRDLEKDLGITYWQAERLSEEGISSIQDLAIADIPSLLVNTRFDIPTLMYWIDKALLQNQVGDDYKYFENVYIKTASDVCDLYSNQNVGIDSIVESFKGQEKEPTKEMIINLVGSFEQGPNIKFISSYWSNIGK